MEVKLNKKDISEYRNSGILKLTNFFNKDEILTLKDNLVKKIKKKGILSIVIMKNLIKKNI